MLTIRYINPTGFFSYGPAPNIDLQTGGLVHLMGVNVDKGNDSNGAGKSSLFNALCEILWGANPTGASGSAITNRVWDRGCCGRVEFLSWEGLWYRVTLTRNWKEEWFPPDNDNQVHYRGSSLYLDRYEDGMWRDRRGSSIAETRTLLTAALGLTYSQFLSIAYLSPRQGNRLLRGGNKERMEILSGVVGLEEWDRIMTLSRTERKELKGALSDLDKEISYEQGALSELEQGLASISSTDWDEEIRKAQQQISEIHTREQEAQSQILQLEQQRDEILVAQKTMRDSSAAREVDDEITALQREVSRLMHNDSLQAMMPPPNAQLQVEADNAKNLLHQLLGEVSAVSAKSGTILTMTECPTCGQFISEQQKTHIQVSIDSLNVRIEEQRKVHAELSQQVEHDRLAKQQQATRIYAEQKARADEIWKQIAEKDQVRKSMRAELDKLIQNSQRVASQISDYKSQLTIYRHEINILDGYIKGYRERINNIEIFKKKLLDKQINLSDLDSRKTEVVDELELLDWLVVNIPYIKIHKLSVALGLITEKTNGYLAAMEDTIRVSFTAFDPKKTAKGGDQTDLLKSEIKLEIVDDGKNIDPRLYSDGETGRVASALIRAMYEVAQESGYGCNLMLLDEIFGFVDHTNAQKLAESFSHFGRAGTMLVTDNSGRATDLLTFDHTWTIRKENGLSTIEVSQ